MGCCSDKIENFDDKKYKIKRNKYKKVKIHNNKNNNNSIENQNDKSYVKIYNYELNHLPNIIHNHNLSFNENDEKENSSFYISKVLETPIQILTQNKMNKIPEDKKPPYESKVIRYKRKESISDSN